MTTTYVLHINKLTKELDDVIVKELKSHLTILNRRLIIGHIIETFLCAYDDYKYKYNEIHQIPKFYVDTFCRCILHKYLHKPITVWDYENVTDEETLFIIHTLTNILEQSKLIFFNFLKENISNAKGYYITYSAFNIYDGINYNVLEINLTSKNLMNFNILSYDIL